MKTYSSFLLLGFAIYGCASNTIEQSNPIDNAQRASGPRLVSGIDESLKKRGLTTNPNQPTRPPTAQLSGLIDEPSTPTPTAVTATLLQDIDANLKKNGQDGSQLPPVPAISLPQDDLAPKEKTSSNKPIGEVLRSVDDALKKRGLDAPKP